jgi:hypothetical protein
MKKIMWCLAISLVPIVLTLAMYGQLPDRIPVHFNSQGQVDGWGPPTVALGFAFVPLGLTLLFVLLPRLSPRRFETELFASAWWTAANIIVGLVALLPLCLLWGAFQRLYCVDSLGFGRRSPWPGPVGQSDGQTAPQLLAWHSHPLDTHLRTGVVPNSPYGRQGDRHLRAAGRRYIDLWTARRSCGRVPCRRSADSRWILSSLLQAFGTQRPA